jgi:hypothetical protein
MSFVLDLGEVLLIVCNDQLFQSGVQGAFFNLFQHFEEDRFLASQNLNGLFTIDWRCNVQVNQILHLLLIINYDAEQFKFRYFPLQ